MTNNLLLSVFLGMILLVSGICTAEAPETNAHLYPNIVKSNLCPATLDSASRQGDAC